ncbi:hypothetical protein QUF90_01355 [Desulfococcaceae bacterium HSG9]|nr:hypothetical protein [Desulfococcaceae bacterium HSG9]
MPQITMTLPEYIYQPVKRVAQSSHKPIETVLLTAINASLPPLDGLSSDLIEELVALETLDSNELRKVLLEIVPLDQQERIEELLYQNQIDDLAKAEKTELSSLQKNADRVMLRKARAAVLLRFRGERLPTLAELRHLTIGKRRNHFSHHSYF